MHTREELRPVEAVADQADAEHLLTGFRRTALLAATALAGCCLLIACGAALSMCWKVHPLLFAVVGVALAWAVTRVAPRLLVRGGDRDGSRPTR